MQTLADILVGLLVLLDRHDADDALLALAHGLLHICVVGLHLLDQCLVVVLLAHHRREVSFLHISVDLHPVGLIQLL